MLHVCCICALVYVHVHNCVMYVEMWRTFDDQPTCVNSRRDTCKESWPTWAVVRSVKLAAWPRMQAMTGWHSCWLRRQEVTSLVRWWLCSWPSGLRWRWGAISNQQRCFFVLFLIWHPVRLGEKKSLMLVFVVLIQVLITICSSVVSSKLQWGLLWKDCCQICLPCITCKEGKDYGRPVGNWF